MLGKAPSTISNKLRLLRLPSAVRERIAEAGLSERHARALLQLRETERMDAVLTQIIEKNLNVAQTERLIRSILTEGTPPRKAPIKLFKDVRLFVNTLRHAVETMQRAGIAADAVQSETADYIEYVVRIPKQPASAEKQPQDAD
jgi:ParB family chromosome partitioning protein